MAGTMIRTCQANGCKRKVIEAINIVGSFGQVSGEYCECHGQRLVEILPAEIIQRALLVAVSAADFNEAFQDQA